MIVIDPLDIVQVAVQKNLRIGPGDALAFRVQNGRVLVQIALREQQVQLLGRLLASDARGGPDAG